MEFYPDVVIGYNRNGWKGDLYWTPSQLYKTITIDDKEYKLYLRWRHSDPWEFSINFKPIPIKDYLAEEYEELINFIDLNIEEIIKLEERHKEHMEQFKHGWNEIQVECINANINLHREYLKKEQEEDNDD